MAKKSGNVIESGTIETKKIREAHQEIKKIVEKYKEVNQEVSEITMKVEENWVGKGRDMFESQYNSLIKKIDDFGDTLIDIYDALVKAEGETTVELVDGVQIRTDGNNGLRWEAKVQNPQEGQVFGFLFAQGEVKDLTVATAGVVNQEITELNKKVELRLHFLLYKNYLLFCKIVI